MYYENYCRLLIWNFQALKELSSHHENKINTEYDSHVKMEDKVGYFWVFLVFQPLLAFPKNPKKGSMSHHP